MANKPKIGLTYFPFDTSFFTDIRVRKLIKYQSGKAVTVYTNLLCDIYKNGYYLKWDKEVPFVLSESTGLDEAFINEVIKCCLTIGLFSQKLFTESKVLTSKGIQERYALICQQTKRKAIVTEYLVIDSEDMTNNTEGMAINSEDYPQSKEKEIKEKESKPKEINNENFWFKINDQLIRQQVSVYHRQNFQSFREQYEMKNGREYTEEIFERMDAEYNCYNFANTNHLQNTFRSLHEKIKKEKNGKHAINSNDRQAGIAELHELAGEVLRHVEFKDDYTGPRE